MTDLDTGFGAPEIAGTERAFTRAGMESPQTHEASASPTRYVGRVPLEMMPVVPPVEQELGDIYTQMVRRYAARISTASNIEPPREI